MKYDEFKERCNDCTNKEKARSLASEIKDEMSEVSKNIASIELAISEEDDEVFLEVLEEDLKSQRGYESYLKSLLTKALRKYSSFLERKGEKMKDSK